MTNRLTLTQWAVISVIRCQLSEGPYRFVGSERTTALCMEKAGLLKRTDKSANRFQVTAKGTKLFERGSI